jgi:ABC-type uncharacterized transport system YnjBCD ATPase subunit
LLALSREMRSTIACFLLGREAERLIHGAVRTFSAQDLSDVGRGIGLDCAAYPHHGRAEVRGEHGPVRGLQQSRLDRRRPVRAPPVLELGPSGAGKSTLLRSLNGLVPLSEGTLEAEGLGVVRGATAMRALRKRTGMVFQQHQLIGRLSALANVLTGRLGHHSALRTCLPLPRADKLIALHALERVGLLDRALSRVDHHPAVGGEGGSQHNALLSHGPPGRARLLMQRFSNPDRTMPFIAETHEELAGELGTAREVVSRVLKEFERLGAIALARGRVELSNENILRSRAAGSRGR